MYFTFYRYVLFMKLKLASAVLGCALLAGAGVYVYQHNTKAVDFQ